jgi:beta-lactamase regulating signal transducer with metallopeptidase domain
MRSRSGETAPVRHALWLTASLKFLVPFAALTALGAQVGPPRRPHTVTTEIVFINASRGDAEAFFTQLAPRIEPRAGSATPLVAVSVIWSIGMLVVVAVWAVRWRRLAAIARAAASVETGREVDALRLVERAVGVASPIRLVQTDSALEPGVFGVRRPILVWPRAIDERLDERQLATILAHEVAHVRRRDNLAAMLHMAVTAIFWFHPLVWWIGARLVDERERACDEVVVRLGHEPRVYAETILTTCRLFLESPLACVSGVTGSDLSKRIERILASVEALTPLKKALVSAVPAAAVIAPFVVGVLNAPPVRAQRLRRRRAKSSSVASVKPNKSGSRGR